MTAEQDKWLRFIETPIGFAFARFEDAHSRAWRLDTSENYRLHPDEERLREAWVEEQQARREFLDLIYGITGI